MEKRKVNWKEESDVINSYLNEDLFSKRWKKVESSNDRYEKLLDGDDTEKVNANAKIETPKSKDMIDKQKVDNKFNNLTDEEKNMIIKDKQDKATRNAESRRRTAKNTGTVFDIICSIFVHVVGFVLVGCYYLGMMLAFCLLPMMIYDYIHVDNGVDSFGIANNGRKFSRREKLAKSYNGRDIVGKILLVIIAVAKLVCWFFLLKYIKQFIPNYSRQVIIAVIVIMVYSILPIHKIGTGMLRKWKEHKENKSKKTEKELSVKQFTEKDITKKDIVKYFHDEVLVDDGTLDTVEEDASEHEYDVNDEDESLADVVSNSLNNQ